MRVLVRISSFVCVTVCVCVWYQATLTSQAWECMIPQNSENNREAIVGDGSLKGMHSSLFHHTISLTCFSQQIFRNHEDDNLRRRNSEIRRVAEYSQTWQLDHVRITFVSCDSWRTRAVDGNIIDRNLLASNVDVPSYFTPTWIYGWFH